MKFKSRIDWLFLSVIFGTIGLCLALVIGTALNDEEGFWGVGIMSSVTILLSWLLLSVLLNTNYSVDEDHIWYESGPFKGKVEIQTIREIQVGKSMWTGLRVATAMNGLIISHGKYDEVYISPDSNSSFIEKIKQVKPDLIIKYD
ncbi:MAG: PH domain-containing protein [Flavobacteriales bacterium]